ncbi:DsbA family protein [Desulfobotulus sp. H1]|uniref:DsbA family protein n=1 Tax=Desulfobotulus pelophilus TaxID=2823377 RepID=A0ABT3NC21_9BACT|nr:DsbA family protein [Desulfobotulus pelophilus]MCW7755009.1 DsbA family protein [Desulfobotulus pelophilus]
MSALRVFSDFACPYCYLAKAMLTTLSKDFKVIPLWIPLELHPETPPSGLMLTKKYPGLDTLAFTRKINQKALPYGIHFCETTTMVNSGRAIRAAEFARDEGLFDPFHTALFEAVFCHNQNIGNPEVLRNIANQQGLDPETMDTAIDEGRFESRLRTAAIEAAERHIRITPTFVVPGMPPFAGLPAEKTLHNILKQASLL